MKLDLCGGSNWRQRVPGCAHARRCVGGFVLLIAEALGANPEVSDTPTALVCFRAVATNVFLQEEDGATFFFCVGWDTASSVQQVPVMTCIWRWSVSLPQNILGAAAEVCRMR